MIRITTRVDFGMADHIINSPADVERVQPSGDSAKFFSKPSPPLHEAVRALIAEHRRILDDEYSSPSDRFADEAEAALNEFEEREVRRRAIEDTRTQALPGTFRCNAGGSQPC